MRRFSSRVPRVSTAVRRPPLSAGRRLLPALPSYPSFSFSAASISSLPHLPSLSSSSSLSSPFSSSLHSLQPIRRLSPSVSLVPYISKRHCSYRRMCSSRRAEESSGSTNIPDGREVLPTNVKPVHYDLTLEPDFEKFTYDGTVVIEYVFAFFIAPHIPFILSDA